MSKKKSFEMMVIGELPPASVFTYGGVNWLVLQRKGAGVLCLAEKILFEQAFDESNYNSWEDSTLREHLNNAFLEELVDAGAEETAFLPMITDLTADDGLKDYGSCEDLIALISCQQYRQYRGIIPNADDWWWTCTAYSTKSNGYSHYARYVFSDGTLSNSNAYYGTGGVRPLCTLKSSILVSVVSRAEETDAEDITEAEETATESDFATYQPEHTAEGEQELYNGLLECVKKAQQDYLQSGGDLPDIVNATGAAINIGRALNG